MKKIYLYFHNDFDGVVSCVLAFHLFKALGFRPVVADAITPEKVKDKKKKFKKPFALLDLIYRQDAFAWFDHHAMNKPKKISKKTKFCAFNGKTKCCAEVIYIYIKKRKIKLSHEKKLKKLIFWAKIVDAPLYAEHGIRAIETIKPTASAMKINIALEKTTSFETKKIAKLLIENPSLGNVLKQDFIEKSLNKLLSLKIKSLIAFKKYSHYDKKIKLVSYDATSFYWNRFAYAAVYPKCEISVGLVKIKRKYYIKISKNPWNRKLSQKIKEFNVGTLLKEFNGGGHHDVGSASFSSYKDAKNVFQHVILEITKLTA